MIKKLLMPEWKRAGQMLAQIGISKGGWKEQTQHYQTEGLAINQLCKPHQINHYIKAMNRNPTISAQLIFKYTVVVHAYLQHAQIIDNGLMYEFMSSLMLICDNLIGNNNSEGDKRNHWLSQNKQYSLQERKNISTRSKSINKSQISTRSDQNFICKEIFLLTSIVRPYISFLLKLISIHSQYRQMKNRKVDLQTYEIWMVLNLLKMIVNITSSFTMIGRYFIKTYCHLPLTFIPLSTFLESQLFIRTNILAQIPILEQFIKILEEASRINEDLLVLYLSKYFYQYLDDLQQPKWINTNSHQFDHKYIKNTNQSKNKFHRHKNQIQILEQQHKIKIEKQLKSNGFNDYQLVSFISNQQQKLAEINRQMINLIYQINSALLIE